MKRLDAEANQPFIIQDQEIYTSHEIKILDVILDTELHYSTHIAQVCKHGINAVLALKQLRT